MSQLQPIVKQDRTGAAHVNNTIIPHIIPCDAQYIPQEMKSLTIWHPWAAQPKPGSDKFRKAPIGTNGFPLATWKQRASWRTYESVIAQHAADGLGIVTNELLIVIDLDDCILSSGALSTFAYNVVKRCNSYTEISPSGKGIKIFARVTADVLSLLRSYKGDFDGEQVAIECLHSGTFATVTGRKLYPETPRTINDVSTGITRILSELPQTQLQAAAIIPPTPTRTHTTQRAEIDRDVIDNYNQRFCVTQILDRSGAKKYSGNLWHCNSLICPVHTGRDGSLYLFKSSKYGVMVKALNPACILHPDNAGGSASKAAFDVMKIYECGGSMIEALKMARIELDQPIKITPVIALKEVSPIPPAIIAPVADVKAILSETLVKIAGDTTLKPSARMVINTLLQAADERACVKVDVESLALACGVSERSVQRATVELETIGYIKKYTDANAIGGNGANVYQLQRVTSRDTRYLNNQTLNINSNDVVKDEVGQVRGGNDQPVPLVSKEEFDATREPKPLTPEQAQLKRDRAKEHRKNPAQRRAPLPCPSSDDLAGLQLFTTELLCEKKHRMVFPTTGEYASWSKKQIIKAIESAFDTVFNEDDIATVIKKARKVYANLEYTNYRSEVRAMTLQDLKKVARQRKQKFNKNKKDNYARIMNEIAQTELADRKQSTPQLAFAVYPVGSAA